MTKKQLIIGIILNLCVFAFALIGIIDLFVTSAGLMGGTALLYFTVQSNIWIGTMCLVFAILQILVMRGKISKIPTWLVTIKFIVTCAITVTFLVYTGLLLPQTIAEGKIDYIMSIQNWSLHFLSPLCAIFAFIFTDRIKAKKWTFTLATITPLLYMSFIYILAAVSGKEYFSGLGTEPSKFPYFFMDFEKNGWFTLDKGFFGLGVFYWIIMIVILVIGIGMLLMYLNKKGSQKTTKQ